MADSTINSYVTREETVSAVQFYRLTIWDVYALNDSRDAQFNWNNKVLTAKLRQKNGTVVGVNDKDYVVRKADGTMEALCEADFNAKYKRKES